MRTLLTLLLLLAVLAGAGYWYWTTTPEYSIREARGAIKTHDIDKFRKYVDAESVASGMVDSFLAGPTREMRGLGIVGHLLTFGLVTFIKPGLVAGLKQEMLDMVERGVQAAQPQDDAPGPSSPHSDGGGDAETPGATASDGISLKRTMSTFGFKGKLYNGTEYTRREGKLAVVGLKLYNQKYNRDFVLDVKLRDMGGYWQVIGLPNLTQLLQELIKLEV
ncbi:MAG TPA: hypothetical protein V6D08_16005, partial [Candidatus Obscuribacterales bacterium]